MLSKQRIYCFCLKNFIQQQDCDFKPYDDVQYQLEFLLRVFLKKRNDPEVRLLNQQKRAGSFILQFYRGYENKTLNECGTDRNWAIEQCLD